MKEEEDEGGEGRRKKEEEDEGGEGRLCLYTNRIQVKPYLLFCDKSICVSQLVRKVEMETLTHHNVICIMCCH